MRKQAIAYLETNRLLHIAMLEAIRRGTAEICEASPRGVLLLDKSSGVHMAAADSESYGRFLADQIESCYQLVVTREDMVAYCMEKFGFTEIFRCRKVARFSSEKVELKTALRIVRADQTRLAQIKAFYHTIPPEEIDEISRRGNLFCAFSGSDFVGFCGNHLDGSLGLLDIFPQYQRRGYGEQLERFMINYMLDKGEIPYGEVVVGNTASVRLQEKLGFDISREIITWLL